MHLNVVNQEDLNCLTAGTRIVYSINLDLDKKIRVEIAKKIYSDIVSMQISHNDTRIDAFYLPNRFDPLEVYANCVPFFHDYDTDELTIQTVLIIEIGV